LDIGRSRTRMVDTAESRTVNGLHEREQAGHRRKRNKRTEQGIKEFGGTRRALNN
jgi:hypothetical protein